jgi:hypothetical protein
MVIVNTQPGALARHSTYLELPREGAFLQTRRPGEQSSRAATAVAHSNVAQSTMNAPPLPSYDEVVDGHPRATAGSSRLRIEPREDEGHERLPGYTCSITTQSIFFKKNEYESAIYKARDRVWNKVFVELQGTALRISKVKNTGVFQTNPDDETPDMPAFVKAGKLLKLYTLQHGDIGIAADYEK